MSILLIDGWYKDLYKHLNEINMNKWIKSASTPHFGEVTLNGYEHLGNVIATTIFEKEDELLYVYKIVKDKSFIFLLKNKNRLEHLHCIPEEVIDNMVGVLVIVDKTY